MLVFKLGVTGGLACGKSAVCSMLKELGAYVISADEIVHKILSPNTKLGQKVIQLIGSDIVVNNKIDRSKIATKVFNQRKLLQSLEELLHPAVREEIERRYQEVNELKQASLFVAEIPLLFETEAEHFFDATVAVIADSNICRQRFMKAASCTLEDYDGRAARQLSPEEKGRRADYIIYNNGSLEELRNSVKELFTVIKNIKKELDS